MTSRTLLIVAICVLVAMAATLCVIDRLMLQTLEKRHAEIEKRKQQLASIGLYAEVERYQELRDRFSRNRELATIIEDKQRTMPPRLELLSDVISKPNVKLRSATIADDVDLIFEKAPDGMDLKPYGGLQPVLREQTPERWVIGFTE